MQSTETCTVENCRNKLLAKGYCYTHYRDARRQGTHGACTAPGCDRNNERKGFCTAHYMRQRRGAPLGGKIRKRWHDRLPELVDLEDWSAVMEKLKGRCAIDAESGCWNYFRVNGKGYGELTTLKGFHLTHRLAAQAVLPDFDPKLQVHHKCANKRCCNPAHLQMVTSRENRAEMMERNYYLSRIAELEGALNAVSPGHHLLL